ncbi:MAG: AMP-binding protein [Propionibacteriaceae bacterium]|jgi:crotonobetaine/carnitine-CoA ligase|nr:AMP-binding protein [Propionibacteriaceae bacterium]
MADIAACHTIADVWASAVECGGARPFLVYLSGDQRSEYTYAEFDKLINRAANAFRALGVAVGDRVVMQIRNSPEFLTCLFGLAKIGAIAVPVGLQAPQAELRATSERVGAHYAVVDSLAGQVVIKPDAATGHWDAPTRHPELVSGSSDDSPMRPKGTPGEPLSYQALCQAASADFAPDPAVTSDTVAELLFTSGTTAAPKGVMITHANVVFSGHYGVWQTSLRAADRLFTTMPACHSNFQLAALTPVLLAGATLVLAERYSASRFWAQVRAERATVIQLIAMMARTLLLQPPTDMDARHDVREVLYFMPISEAEKNAFETRFGVRFMNSYGSTESIGWAVTDPPTGPRRWPSVGRAGLGYEVGIFDTDGNQLPPGVVGEFRIKGIPGRSLMLGYYGDPEATQRALVSCDLDSEGRSAWLRTSDQGYMDSEGWFHFVDRAQNVIKRSGENISTTEVENTLTAHPGIAEAAVIGVPDPMRDQAVKAFVRLSDPTLTPAEISAYCLAELACYKVPEFIEVVTDFPRTSSMKIEKRLLK